MIALSNVDISAAGGGDPVADDLSFRIEQEGVHEIVGPSGVGKTALFEVMTLRRRPARGSVVLAGRNVDRLGREDLADARCDIGSCAQQPVLLEQRTPVENAVLPMVVRGRSDEAADAAEEALGFLGILSRGDRPVGTLSMQDRILVALARATVGNPSVVVVDGVHERLEPAVRGLALSWLEEVAESGCTVVVLGRRPTNRRSSSSLWRLDEGRISVDGGAD